MSPVRAAVICSVRRLCVKHMGLVGGFCGSPVRVLLCSLSLLAFTPVLSIHLTLMLVGRALLFAGPRCCFPLSPTSYPPPPPALYATQGVIVYIMLSGRPPFDDIDQVKLIKKIKYHSVEFAGRDWVLISEEGKDFLSRLLHKDPSDRMDAKQALKHRWLKNNRNEATTANLFNVAQTNVIRYNAMKRWKAAIHLVQALNRMQSGIVLSQPVSGNFPPSLASAGAAGVPPSSGWEDPPTAGGGGSGSGSGGGRIANGTAAAAAGRGVGIRPAGGALPPPLPPPRSSVTPTHPPRNHTAGGGGVTSPTRWRRGGGAGGGGVPANFGSRRPPFPPSPPPHTAGCASRRPSGGQGRGMAPARGCRGGAGGEGGARAGGGGCRRARGRGGGGSRRGGPLSPRRSWRLAGGARARERPAGVWCAGATRPARGRGASGGEGGCGGAAAGHRGRPSVGRRGAENYSPQPARPHHTINSPPPPPARAHLVHLVHPRPVHPQRGASPRGSTSSPPPGREDGASPCPWGGEGGGTRPARRRPPPPLPRPRRGLPRGSCIRWAPR